MPIEIRVLGPGDEGLLASAGPDVFDDPVTPELAAAFLRDPHHYIAVAVDDGVVVGFASGVHYAHPDKAAELWINEVGVAESHRRRGLAAAALRALLDVGRRLGCGEAWVLTDRSNDAAMRLYASLGAGPPADAVMFTFDLGRPTEAETPQ